MFKLIVGKFRWMIKSRVARCFRRTRNRFQRRGRVEEDEADEDRRLEPRGLEQQQTNVISSADNRPGDQHGQQSEPAQGQGRSELLVSPTDQDCRDLRCELADLKREFAEFKTRFTNAITDVEARLDRLDPLPSPTAGVPDTTSIPRSTDSSPSTSSNTIIITMATDLPSNS